MPNSVEKAKELVEKFNLSETVKQEMIKIIIESYQEGYNDCFYENND